MIKNFEEVKKQLAELSEVVNKFKSEAVQLRIVDLVFAGGSVPEKEDVAVDDVTVKPPRRRPSRKRKAVSGTAPSNGENKKARAVGKGPKATLEKFIAEGFFNQKRSIGAVVDHCGLKAQHFKANELSGPLGRLVRDNTLSRTKNAEGQYEYVKK